MKNLRLSDEILLQVEKPARYLGNEINSVIKNKSEIDIRYALCFPDIYEIGMSHLGLQILYHLLNQRSDTWGERVFSPDHDLSKVLVDKDIPLFALESQDNIKDFDFLGFTIQYEMCYTNILDILSLSKIPVFSKDRTEDDPIIMAGGPCVYNTEPLADFIDLFYIGEAECALDQILDIYKENKRAGSGRLAFLQKAAQIDGVYIPAFYDVTYQDDGTIHEFKPNNEYGKPVIKKQVMMELSKTPYPDKPIVPFIKTVHDRVVLELFRGCIRGCRFCQAGMIYRPVREKEVEDLKRQALSLIKNTGHDEISLISLSSSDYTQLEAIIDYLLNEVQGKGVNISLPSLRIDAFSLDVMSKVQDVKKSSLTFAPEAGSQRLRDVINKGLSEEDILGGSKQAFVGGWNRVKLYFMLGLPTETYEDIEGIATLAQQIVEEYFSLPKDQRNGRIEVVVSTSFFVPKPFTPFQWMRQDSNVEFLDKQKFLSTKINRKHIKYNWHDAKLTFLEGVMARGDRRVGQAIYEAYKLGAKFDAWSEHFDYGKWMQAFEIVGIDPTFYVTRERPLDEFLPWDFIDAGVTKKFLLRELERGTQEKITPNCRVQCVNCGLRIQGGGVCYEN